MCVQENVTTSPILETRRRLIRPSIEVTAKEKQGPCFSSDNDNKAGCLAARPEGRKKKLLFNSLQDTYSIVWVCLLCNPPSPPEQSPALLFLS